MSLNDKAFSSELLDVISRKLNSEVNSRESYEEVMKHLLFPSVRIHYYQGILGKRFFQDAEDLIYYLNHHAEKSGVVCALEYLGNSFGSEDVIRIVNQDGSFKICALRDEETYSVLDMEALRKTGSIVWNFEFGSLRDEVLALRNAGVNFKSDIFLERGDLFDRFKAFASGHVGDSAKYKLVPKE